MKYYAKNNTAEILLCHMEVLPSTGRAVTCLRKRRPGNSAGVKQRQTGKAGCEPTQRHPAGWAWHRSALSGLDRLPAVPRNLPETHPGPPAHAGATHHPEEAVLETQSQPSDSTVPSGVLTDGHNVHETLSSAVSQVVLAFGVWTRGHNSLCGDNRRDETWGWN